MNRSNSYNYMSKITDYGPEPLAINIDKATKTNTNFRTALWTGDYLQVTLMCIPVYGDIGLEMHPCTDQFIRVESGCGLVMMGKGKNALNYQKEINENGAVIVPAGTWHNIVNIGNSPLKVYSIYAPPHHPFGTVEKTKCDADKEHKLPDC